MEITITKLERPQYHGDWHDKPCRWSVNGPRSECKVFSCKKDALRYKSIRVRHTDQLEAINAYRN